MCSSDPPNTALDILPLPLHERTDMDFDKRADYMKTLHESTRATLKEHTKRQATKINKLKKPMISKKATLCGYTSARTVSRMKENPSLLLAVTSQIGRAHV